MIPYEQWPSSFSFAGKTTRKTAYSWSSCCGFRKRMSK